MLKKRRTYKLQSQLERKLPRGMYVPKPLAILYKWMEDNGLYYHNGGRRVGFLYSPDKLSAESTDAECPGGTQILFWAQGNKDLKYWFGHNRRDVLNRLCVFAKTGAEGSMAALWIDDRETQRIVHLGSGSGSSLVCVLADDPVDFLRLLAIGYQVICWDQHFSKPPNSGNGQFVHPNVEYQAWVKRTFSVRIPKTASKIVRYPSNMVDAQSRDDFFNWVKKNTG